MTHRRFPRLRIFHRARPAPDVWEASSEGVAAASWADAFRVEHADLVGERPGARPRRHRWFVAASILGLVVMATVLHADLRRAASGSKRGVDMEQRRTAIAEAVSQELVRTREAFEAYRMQAMRDLATAQDALAARETSLHQAEQARQAADNLATERVRTVESLTSDLATARREAAQAQAQATITEARLAAHDAAQAAQVVARADVAVIESAPHTPSQDLIATSPRQDEPIPAKAEGRTEPSGVPVVEEGALAAGEGLRFGRSNMAWLPLAETAFMALDAGHPRTDAAPVASEGGGPSCLDRLPPLPAITSPHANGKGARSTRAEARNAALPRARQRAGARMQPSRARGAAVQQHRAPAVGPDLLTGGRPAPLPDRS